jgi:hypothetical protein
MKLRDRPTALLLAALLPLAAGCGGNHDATEKQLAELRAEVTKLRATQAALTERLDSLEIKSGTFAKGAPEAAPAAAPPQDRDRPELQTVRLSPSEGDGDIDDSQRPVISASGNGGSVTLSKKDKAPGAKAPKKGVATAAPKKADVPKP